jgi:hypothetical protein
MNSQILALFEETYQGYKANFLKVENNKVIIQLDKIDALSIIIEQPDKYIIKYKLTYPDHRSQYILTFDLIDINLKAILDPQYITNLCTKMNLVDSSEFLSLKLTFELKDNYIEIYKQACLFPEIYYRKINYNIESVILLHSYKAATNIYAIAMILSDKCDDRLYQIKSSNN